MVCYNAPIAEMDIHHLKIFVSVYKRKSFSKASEELHLTQPTVSDHIKSLEEEFSLRLFDRLGRTIVPTKEAEALYDHAVEILEKAEQIREVAGQFKRDVTGELVIGASSIPGTYLMPPIIAAFKKAHPETSFELIVSDSRDIAGRVLKHELIAGVVGAKLTNPQLHYVPFKEDVLIVVASPWVRKESLTLQDLLGMPMIMREEGSGTRREVEKILEGNGVSIDEVKIAGIFGSTDAVKQAVKAGLGIAIVSKFSVIDELRCKVLKQIRLKDVQMKRSFYTISHKKRTLPHAYRTFLEHVWMEAKKL